MSFTCEDILEEFVEAARTAAPRSSFGTRWWWSSRAERPEIPDEPIPFRLATPSEDVPIPFRIVSLEERAIPYRVTLPFEDRPLPIVPTPLATRRIQPLAVTVSSCERCGGRVELREGFPRPIHLGRCVRARAS